MDKIANVVTSMLKAFNFDVYVLLNPVANLSFVTLFLANRFAMSLKILHDHFLVSTPVGESIIAKRV